MGKEGKFNVIFIISLLLLSLLMAFMVIGVGIISGGTPGNTTINTSTTRNINFTFTPTWNNTGEVVGNCSLFTNFSGTFSIAMEINGSNQSASTHNGSGSITNGSLSWMNFTFTHDIGVMNWIVACENGTAPGAVYNFSSGNRTIAIDTAGPIIVQTADIFQGFNTTSTTPTITINFTDVNGTGVNLTVSTVKNLTLNITLLDVNDGADTVLQKFNISTGNLTCSPSGDGVQASQCTLDLTTTTILTNGTKNISVAITDRAAFTTESSFTFTVDQIPPVLKYVNITNSNQLTGATAYSVLNESGSGHSIRQGSTIFLTTNLSDNLTQPLNVSFQFLNISNNGGTWQVVDTQKVQSANGSGGVNVDYWGNASFVIPTGRNEFEGKNVSFRVQYNDTLGNSNTTSVSLSGTGSIVLIVQINDTYAPIITINATDNGVAMINGSNISNTRPLISWAVDERNKLQSINITTIAGSTFTRPSADGGFEGCNRAAFFSASATGTDNVETGDGGRGRRNSSMQISEESTCKALSNGTHFINITTIDVWGNQKLTGLTFTVDTIAGPTIDMSANVNNTNLTSKGSITITNTDSFTGVPTTTWTTPDCGGSGNYTSATAFFPFNDSSGACTGAAVRTLTITATDGAGNSNVSSFLFGVDVTAPVLNATTPTDGQTFAANTNVTFNLTSTEGFVKTSFIGYYLDGGALTQIAFDKDGLGNTKSEVARNISLNLTGTHTVIFTVNDTVGNFVNISAITFTKLGSINLFRINNTLKTASTIVSNVTLFNSSGDIVSDSSTPRSIDQTFELFMALNSSVINPNVSINFNGSAANWDALNFTITYSNISDTSNTKSGIENNFTAQIIQLISFNSSTDSLDEFISDADSYYGFIDLTLNATNVSNTVSGGGNLGGTFELWYFTDEISLNSKQNITECSANKVITHKTAESSTFPCWNNTLNRSVRVYVPHFSHVAFVNDSRPPTVTVNSPASAQGVSGFVPNITVSSDATSCRFILNITNFNKTSATANVSSAVTPVTVGNDDICAFSEVRFKDGAYNITYNVTDAQGNINLTSGVGERAFTVSDTTAPNNGTSITSSGATTGATITVNSVNESITNITLVYGTTATALSLRKSQTITATKSPSIGSLGIATVTTATLYYYNVSICDFNDNCNTTSNLTFTQSATAAGTTTTTTTTTGGGGGGAAAVSNIADSKGQLWSTIPSGSSVSLNIDKTTIAVTSVEVNNVKSDLKNVDLEVASLKDNPVSADAAAKVYQYFRINKKNIADSDAESFKISFRVTKTWLTDNGLTSGDISLYRYKSGWNELTTTVTGTDDTYVNYEADTPGFSSFAIGTKSGVEVAEEVPEGEAPEEVPEGEVAPPEPVEAPEPVVAPGKAPVAWIIAAIVIILGIVLIVLYQKKKQQV